MIGKFLLIFAYSLSGGAKTLFVCEGNTGRSYMAEAIALVHFQHDAFSRGLIIKGREPEKHAVTVMAELGIRHQHQASALGEIDLMHADLVLTMTAAQQSQLKQLYPAYSNKMKTLSACALGVNEDVLDAYGQSLSFYRQRRDQIFNYEAILAQRLWHCV